MGYLDKHERRYNPDLSSGYSKYVWRRIPEKIVSGSLDLKMDRKKDYILKKMSVQPEIIELLSDLQVSVGSAIWRDLWVVEEFYSLIAREEVRLEEGFIDLITLAILAGYKFRSKNMIAMGVQIQGTLLNKNVFTGDDCWGVRWQQVSESLKCCALGDIRVGFVSYNVLVGLLPRVVFLDPDVLSRVLKFNQKTAVDWFLEKRSGIKRKSCLRPGKLKRMRMRSLKEIGAGSTAEEPAGIPQSQPAPGSSRVRDEYGGTVSRPKQEDSDEEVVMFQEDDEVILEEELEVGEKKEVEVSKRRSTPLRFPSRAVESPPTYDELIEAVPWIAFPDDLDIELEIPWDRRFF